MFFSLLSDTVPQWVSNSFPVIQTILLVLIGVLAIVITIAVLLQPSNPDGGSNAITGTNDSYYAQNRGATREGKLNKLIIICAVSILICTIAYFVTLLIY